MHTEIYKWSPNAGKKCKNSLTGNSLYGVGSLLFSDKEKKKKQQTNQGGMKKFTLLSNY